MHMYTIYNTIQFTDKYVSLNRYYNVEKCVIQSHCNVTLTPSSS